MGFRLISRMALPSVRLPKLILNHLSFCLNHFCIIELPTSVGPVSFFFFLVLTSTLTLTLSLSPPPPPPTCSLFLFTPLPAPPPRRNAANKLFPPTAPDFNTRHCFSNAFKSYLFVLALRNRTVPKMFLSSFGLSLHHKHHSTPAIEGGDIPSNA